MAARGKIIIDRERCKGCRLCLEVCPRDCLEPDTGLNKKGYQPVLFRESVEDKKGCNACTMCGLVCPEAAIEVYRAEE